MDRDEIEALILESGLDPAEFGDVADLLATVATAPRTAPAPSPALARLLSKPAQVPTQRRRRAAAIIGGGSLALVLTLSGAAAANLLPRPIQEFLHDVTEGGLPIEFPAPPAQPSPDEDPAFAPRPTLAPPTAPSSSPWMTHAPENESAVPEESRPEAVPTTPPAGVPAEPPAGVGGVAPADDPGRDTPDQTAPAPTQGATEPSPVPVVAPTPTRPGGTQPTGESRSTDNQKAAAFTDGAGTRHGAP